MSVKVHLERDPSEDEFSMSSVILKNKIEPLFKSVGCKVKGKGAYATHSISYLSADDEDRVMIAQSDEKLSKNSQLTSNNIRARIKGDFPIVSPDKIDFMDVAPNQILSVAASLIPFLEHDDANRALMGSNMQRQSVPLMNPDEPIVGTGLESKVAVDSRSAVVSPVNGRIQYVDAEKVVIKTTDVPEGLALIEKRTGKRLDLSRIDFDDQRVYDLICQSDTIGVFQVESAAQMQTTPRINPRNLFDMARQVASVRPVSYTHLPSPRD